MFLQAMIDSKWKEGILEFRVYTNSSSKMAVYKNFQLVKGLGIQ